MYIIDREKCSYCGLCSDVCPVEAINPIGVYEINQELCIQCGECYKVCPCNAIKTI